MEEESVRAKKKRPDLYKPVTTKSCGEDFPNHWVLFWYIALCDMLFTNAAQLPKEEVRDIYKSFFYSLKISYTQSSKGI